jgi:DNA-binding transcriptional ArsR family regulator
MVKYPAVSLDAVFSALADPTRRGILERLARGEATVTELAAPFARDRDMSLPAVSKHIRILENAGLVVRQKEGREHHLRLAAAPMQDAAEWIAQYRRFWEGQFDSLARYLAESRDSEADE